MQVKLTQNKSDLMLPNVVVKFDPQGSDDPRPYIASVHGDGFVYHAKGTNPSEALLLVAAHWHARAHYGEALK